MPLAEQGAEVAGFINTKAFNDAFTQAVLASTQNMLAHQNAMQQALAGHFRALDTIRETTLALWSKGMVEIDPVEAAASVTNRTSDDIANKVVNAILAMGANQQTVKAATTTPPVTP
jgi:hypothetical protein